MIQRLLLLVCVLTLTACHSLSRQEQVAGTGSKAVWQHHQQQTKKLDAWQIDGKLAVRSEAQSGSGVLFWLQRQDYFDIRVSGPLGQGSTRLTGHTGKIQLTTPQLQRTAESAEQLMDEQLGWSLPVENLYWWVRGLPNPNRPYQLRINAQSTAEHLIQDDWQLEFISYLTTTDGIPLPERIKLQGPELQLTLVIKQWQARELGR